MKKLYFIFLLIFSISLFADNMSPLGKWKTIDDETGEEKSIIKVWEDDGEIFGTIESLFLEPDEDPNPLCDECKGNLFNKPIIGMTILNNLEKDGNEWKGGTILDPNNGKTYKCKIEVVENGKKLKVRGFIGVSLLGRTQYWHRVE
ncbi:MAG: DUF2147 domain-containing protein [Candidatus Cloacimonetes bacterium]|nr:DUF2147 domain-containing protein [Candidatus Cloacimonadota bacterium]MCF7814496.1 DUF2147 domain-containing protein [Candidatus Cloacimonadota bacterium]MCF7869069.1 DUF2147 domain-containing protein [Candidatus Cloacimonadota bacterium]MCF7884464.1 DUF2147 domain-containing protein [Candidatus Cloacimonadota bacterium]